MNRKIFCFFIVFTFLFLTQLSASQNKKIFIVASYSEKDLCGSPQYKGILSALKESEFQNLVITSIYLDSKRLAKKALERRKKALIQRIDTEKPYLIITIDDLAFSVVAPSVVGNGPPWVVFSGLNRSLEEYNNALHFLKGSTPQKNITGVYENLFMPEQIKFFDLISPNRKKIALLYSTDFMGNILKDQVVKELEDAGLTNRLVFFSVADMDELEQKSTQIENNPQIGGYIPLTMSVKGENGEKYTIRELAPILIRKVKKIDLALNMAFTKSGFLGGVSVDFYHMGHQAGELAVNIIRQYPISRLSVQKAERYRFVINKRRLQSLGLKLPEEVYNMLDELVL